MSTKSLLATLDSAQHIIQRRDMYYRGKQPLRFMRDRVDDKLMHFSSNIGRVAVRSVAERIHMDEVTAEVDGRDVSDTAKRLIQDSDLPMLMQSVVADMLAVGSAYLIVWVDDQGRAVVTGESAEQVAVQRHPITRAVTGAVKRWDVTDANGVVVEQHVVKYGPDKIVHLKRDGTRGRLSYDGSTPNPLGVVPVVPLINVERINDDTGASVMDDLAPLVDALNKVFVDMLTTSDAVARPKRYATGVVLEDEDEGGFMVDDDTDTDADPVGDGVQSPFKDSDDLWIAEQPEAKFGQLAGADLSGYSTAADLIMQQIMTVTSLPPHLVGIASSNPATAEALRASEVGLASNAHSRIRVINRPMEWAVRLLVAIDQGVSPDRVSVNLTWQDTATSSVAQEADAAVKLHAEGITSTDEARATVGENEEV